MLSAFTKWTAAAAITCAPSLAQAELIVNEPFDYAAGDLMGSSNGGWGWLGGWVIGANATPTYQLVSQDIATPLGYAAPSGRQLYIDPNAASDTSGGATPDVRRLLAAPIDMDVSQTLYFSMLVQRQDATNDGGTEHSSYLRLNDASGTKILEAGQESNEAFRIADKAHIKDMGVPGSWAIGQDYLLVAKLVTNPAGTDDVFSASLFAPGSALAEPTAWALSLSMDQADQIVQLQLNPQRRAGKAYIDEIRIGTTFVDVTTIPEPATIGLIAAGVASLLRRGKRITSCR